MTPGLQDRGLTPWEPQDARVQTLLVQASMGDASAASRLQVLLYCCCCWHLFNHVHNRLPTLVLGAVIRVMWQVLHGPEGCAVFSIKNTTFMHQVLLLLAPLGACVQESAHISTSC